MYIRRDELSGWMFRCIYTWMSLVFPFSPSVFFFFLPSCLRERERFIREISLTEDLSFFTRALHMEIFFFVCIYRRSLQVRRAFQLSPFTSFSFSLSLSSFFFSSQASYLSHKRYRELSFYSLISRSFVVFSFLFFLPVLLHSHV